MRRRLLYNNKKSGDIQSAIAGGVIFTTTDGWETFTERTSLGNGFTDIAICKSAPLNQSAIKGVVIYMTTDGWDTFTVPPGAPATGNKIAISGSEPLVQTVTDNRNRRICSTTNGWATFVERPIPADIFFIDVAICESNPRVQTVITRNGYIYTTESGWLGSLAKTDIGTFDWQSIAVSSDPLRQTAVVYGFYIMVTTDGWATASAVGPGFHDWIKAVIAPSDPLIQTAIERGTGGAEDRLCTTADGWATYTIRSVRKAWTDIGISKADPLKQTAAARYSYICTTTDGWATFVEHTNLGNRNWSKIVCG